MSLSFQLHLTGSRKLARNYLFLHLAITAAVQGKTVAVVHCEAIAVQRKAAVVEMEIDVVVAALVVGAA